MIAYNIQETQIILTKDGKHYVVNREEDSGLYKEVKECIKNNELEEAIDLLDVAKVYEKAGFTIKDGLVCVGGEALPLILSDKILKFNGEGLPFQPLLNFWDNLKNNPSYRARNDLYDFLNNNGHPITEDGCFIAYKAVNQDFTDKHTGKMDNSIGIVVKMNRTMVDDNPNNTCSSGLHFGAWDYVQDFCGSGIILEIKVNPKNVVSIPTDYNQQKGRCCEFEVLSVVEQRQESETMHNHTDHIKEEAQFDYNCDNCGAQFDSDELDELDYDQFYEDCVGSCPDCGSNVE